MDNSTTSKALAGAYAKIAAAQKNLIGRRVPLAGTQRDVDRALADLLAAQSEIAQAIRLIEIHQSRGVSSTCA